MAITDHSKRVTMANGLDAKRLRQQWAEIDALNERLKGFTVLKGVEVDILEGGGLDLPDDVLAEADWVVASVHYGQKQSREQITAPGDRGPGEPARLGHRPSHGPADHAAQALRDRPGAVMKAASEHGKMLELNAHPTRLDLDDVACAAAKGTACRSSSRPTAHNVDGLDAMRYGVLQARRGGLTKADVANTRPLGADEEAAEVDIMVGPVAHI